MALDMGRYAPPISCAPKHRCVSMQPICCNRCMYGRQVFTKRHNHCACVPSAVTIARTASRRNPSAVSNHCTYEHSIGHHPTAVATSMAEDTNKNNTPGDRKNELQYHDVSTYLRAWYKRKKTIPP